MKKTMVWICTGILAASAITYTGLFKHDSVQQQAESLSTQQKVQAAQPVQPTFSSEAVDFGSYGQDVYELQSRLKLLGFFGGTVDSNFGSSTLTAVKGFQKEFGIKPDGVVGAKTKLKLVNATPHWKPTETPMHRKNQGSDQGQAANNNNDETMGSANTMGLSENDLKIMANAVYGESRGEPFEGQVAVAAVILNRVKSPSFPNTPSGVIFQPGAFTAVADGQIWLTPNETAQKAVRQALNGWDPSGGCLYYFNPKTATSKWIWSRPQVKTIGEHIFCM
ncbi:spore cortex-lytic enzyme [Paenibacillus sp. CMAA1739]|uniref:Spore cortex-lytic enzyme n=1 Tax=Paenibacillus ottowii TaxID=2315729 RepID=A0ABY3B6G0_9BACL|nr:MULTISPECIES: spore cortex-lytic enzyme [Paenibacillus]NEU25401.1 spore cortex-lytic enzyme [Paenibacillus polymyxa]MDP1510941.1 spore cortex-lytic enzyme [Paenibacillus ottowii]MEC4566562.1 spore cortex-lytic enzyme [Paenibacillus sp. CMAA1739]QDY82252.1 spore cortex-lytic enzyme [Paenibacillus polymyxa]TQR98924.1 spore cortex-lytic enzyme [Paenibacillus ottowii]